MPNCTRTSPKCVHWSWCHDRRVARYRPGEPDFAGQRPHPAGPRESGNRGVPHTRQRLLRADQFVPAQAGSAEPGYRPWQHRHLPAAQLEHLAQNWRSLGRGQRVCSGHAVSQGINQSLAGTDQVNAILNLHLATARIGKPGAAPSRSPASPTRWAGARSADWLRALPRTWTSHPRTSRASAGSGARRRWLPNRGSRRSTCSVSLARGGSRRCG